MDGRRREVQNLLARGSSQQLLCTAPCEARALLEEAFRLAWREPPLAGPVRHLVAYHLAHAVMRSAGGREDMARADHLFAAAGGSDLLGPLPWIYRLAALHRLDGDGSSEPIIEEVCRGARRNLADGIEAVPPALAAPDLDLLELACYFLGRTHGLESPGGVLDGLAPAGFEPWIVLGGSGAGPALRLPEAWATAEVEEYAASCGSDDVIVFRLCSEGAEWRAPGQPWVPARLALLRLLVALLLEPGSRGELEQRALAESTDRGGTLRQYKYRLEAAIRELLGKPELPVFASSPRGGVFELAPTLHTIGAVQAVVLQTW